jgi:hypothetical protein
MILIETIDGRKEKRDCMQRKASVKRQERHEPPCPEVVETSTVDPIRCSGTEIAQTYRREMTPPSVHHKERMQVARRGIDRTTICSLWDQRTFSVVDSIANTPTVVLPSALAGTVVGEGSGTPPGFSAGFSTDATPIQRGAPPITVIQWTHMGTNRIALSDPTRQQTKRDQTSEMPQSTLHDLTWRTLSSKYVWFNSGNAEPEKAMDLATLYPGVTTYLVQSNRRRSAITSPYLKHDRCTVSRC